MSVGVTHWKLTLTHPCLRAIFHARWGPSVPTPPANRTLRTNISSGAARVKYRISSRTVDLRELPKPLQLLIGEHIPSRHRAGPPCHRSINIKVTAPMRPVLHPDYPRQDQTNRCFCAGNHGEAFQPAEAVATAGAFAGALPVVLTRVGRDSPQIAATVETFAAAAGACGARLEVIDVPNGRHGFDTLDQTDESRA